MKKILLLLLTLTLAFTSALFVTSCKDKGGSKGHEHSYSSSYVDPTCEEQGGTKYVCSCGDEYWEDVVPELGHNPSSEWTIDKQATCTQTGLKSHHCLTCKKHLDETVIALLPHSIDDGVCTVCKNSFYAQGLTYALNNTETEYSVTGIGSYSGSDLYIPQTYNDLPVTGIAAYAFSQQTQLKSVNIPKNIKSIGDYAFNGCVNITRIEFDASSCSDFNENNNVFSYVGQSQNGTTVAIGKNVAKIPAYFLYSSTKTNAAPRIKDVNFDKATSLQRINKYAFAGCTALNSLTITKNVKTIEYGVFYGCSYLQDITLPFIGEKQTFLTDDDSTHKTLCYTFSPFNESSLVGSYGAEYVPSSLKTVIVTDYEPSASAFSNCTKLESVTIKTASKVSDNLFYNCTSLTSVTLPDGITEIGENAFYGCKKLETFTFTEKLTIIKDSAFYNCSLANLSFNDKLEEIGTNAFYGCKKITTLVFPTELKTIKNGAFAECSALASLSFNDRIEEIASFAFGNCTSLKEITLPSSLTKIGTETFKGCLYIEKITLPFIGTEKTLSGTYGENNLFGAIFSSSNVEYDSTKSEENQPDFHTYKITQNYKSNGSVEFWIPKTLKSITLNGSELKYGELSGLSDLITVTFGSNLTKINSYAFKNCSCVIAWENATITEFGDYSFYYYQGKNISIPASVTNISNNAFLYCENLLSFSVSDGNEKYSSLDGNLCNKDGTTLIRYAMGKPSTDFTTPTNISSIANNAFHGCTSLTSITISNSVTNIGDYNVLTNCTSLTSITIGNGVTALPDNLLKDCSSIEEITIPFVGATLNGTSNTHFGYIFGASSYSKNSSYVPASLKKVTVIGGNILSYAFYNCNNVTTIILPNNITSISDRAFQYCSSLTSINIPDSVTSIDTEAFEYCSSLTSVTIGNNVTSINSWAFSECDLLENIYYTGDINSWVQISGLHCLMQYGKSSKNLYINGTLLTEANITTATSVNKYAFYNYDKLTKVTIGDQVESIDSYAFYGCSSLEEITIPFVGATLNGTSNTRFGYIFGYSVPASLKKVTVIGGNIPSYAFNTCDNVTAIVLPNNITSIGDEAFRSCSSLTSINIPDSVTSIGDEAFGYCSSLTSINIPDSVTSIGSSVFRSCSSLTSITIPDNVTSIGDEAFRSCSSLTSITIPDNVTSIGKSAFYDCYKLVEVINKSSINITKGSSSNGYVGYYAICVHNGDSLIKTVDDYQFITYDNVNYLFNYLGNDTEITLPSNYNGENYQIYNYAFYNNTKLTGVTIPDSVTSIGEEAFYGCVKLVEVINKSSLKITKGSSNNGNVGYYALYIHNGDSLIKTVGDYQFITYDNVNYLLGYIGNDTEITLPSNYNGENYQIYEYAFYYNTKLTKVTIPDSVTSIGYEAFCGCSSLTSVTIGNGVTKISRYAFRYCRSLTSVTFKNTSGWYVTKDSSETSGTNVDVTNTSQNTTYLTSTYDYYYWKRTND